MPEATRSCKFRFLIGLERMARHRSTRQGSFPRSYGMSSTRCSARGGTLSSLSRAKILEISPEMPFSNSGIGRLVGQLSSFFQASGYKVDILYPTRRFREFKLSSIPLRHFSDYDIVHLHGPTPFLSDLVLARNSHRVVYTHHAQI